MEFLSGIGHGVFGVLVPFLFVLTLVVFVHEYGHFIVARWCGVRVNVFSIGFGPEIFGRTDRHGTRWRVSAIPLGGYVKFEGDANAASMPERGAPAAAPDSFPAQSVAARAAIVAAGPAANLLFAIAVFAALFLFLGKPVIEARVGTVQPGSAAEEAGIAPGDVIRAIDGAAIESFGDVQRIVSLSADDALEIAVDRDGEALELTATPRRTEVTDRFGNVHKIGVLGITNAAPEAGGRIESFSIPGAILEGAKETWFITSSTFAGIGRIIVGRSSMDELGGPIKIAQISGQVATLGIAALLQWVATISVSIGLLNLMPIPMLDGGHLVYYAVESVRGRPLSERVQDVGFRIGFVLVLLLTIYVAWNDIVSQL